MKKQSMQAENGRQKAAGESKNRATSRKEKARSQNQRVPVSIMHSSLETRTLEFALRVLNTQFPVHC